MKEALEVVRQRRAVRQAAQASATQLETKLHGLSRLSGASVSPAYVELGEDDTPLSELLGRADQVSDRIGQAQRQIGELEAELEKAQKFQRTVLIAGGGAAVVLVLILFALMN